MPKALETSTRGSGGGGGSGEWAGAGSSAGAYNAKSLVLAGRQRQPPSTDQCVLPAESFGEVNPYTRPIFPLAFSKDLKKKTEKTCRSVNPSEEPACRPASLGSQQLTTLNQIDQIGKTQGKRASCRGPGLLRAGCREVPGEGARSGGLSSHSAFIKKFPVHDPSGSSQGVSLMNPGAGFRLLFPPSRGRGQFSFLV